MPTPPKPLEERRRKGRSPGRDSGGRKLPDPANVVQLHGVDGDLPPLPASLVEDGAGAARWERIWREARWLSPAADAAIITRLCEVEDRRQGMKEALAAEGFYVVGSQGQMRPNPLIAQVKAAEAQILQMEGVCGLTPSSRGAMGVGEVKGPVANPLNDLLTKAANRHAGRRSGRAG